MFDVRWSVNYSFQAFPESGHFWNACAHEVSVQRVIKTRSKLRYF